MATSGSFNTSSYSGRYLKFSWSVSSQSVSDCSTKISWTLKGAGGDSTWYMSGNFKLVINGSTVYSSATRIQLKNGTTVASGTTTIKHDTTTGNKTFSARAEAGIYSVAVNVSGSGSFTLPTIPRGSTSVQSVASKTETTITMNWSSDHTVDYIWYSKDNGSSWSGVDVTDGKSGSYKISNLEADTTYKIKTRVRRKDTQVKTDSEAKSVTTYDIPHAYNLPNFTIGEYIKFNLYNPLGRSVKVYMITDDNNVYGGDVTSADWFGGYSGGVWVERLYNSILTKKSGNYAIKVECDGFPAYTVRENTKYTVNESECSPIIGSFTYVDQNGTSTAITGNDQDIVRNQSRVQYYARDIQVRKGASIESASITVNGNTYSLSIHGTTAMGGGYSIDSASDVDAVVTVRDSRGVTTDKNVTVHMLDWKIPSAIITMNRQNSYYSECDLTVDAEYSSTNENNEVTITYTATKDADYSVTVSGTVEDNVKSVVTLDNLYEWSVQIVVEDSFGGRSTYNAHIAKGVPIIYFDRVLSSVGVNCFPEEEGTLDVAGKLVVDGSVDVTGSLKLNGADMHRNAITARVGSSYNANTVNAYTVIPLNYQTSYGDKLTLTEEGGIRVGANVSRVLISARLGVEATGSTGNRHLRVFRNDTQSSVAWGFHKLEPSEQVVINIPPCVFPASEGDVYTIRYYCPAKDSIKASVTSMTIETLG